ncbi:nucleoside diphosphate-linked moiety X motif 6-like [Styela clava]
MMGYNNYSISRVLYGSLTKHSRTPKQNNATKVLLSLKRQISSQSFYEKYFGSLNKLERIRDLFDKDVKLENVAKDLLPYSEDRYRGIHVVIDREKKCNPKYHNHMLKILDDSIAEWKLKGKTAVWIHVPIEKSAIIPSILYHGFKFHHAEDEYSSLSLWLHQDVETRIPIAASHQVGVGGCCIDDSGRMLVIQEKRRPVKVWKIPGGFSYLGENFDNTAKREVYEETGIETEYQSIIGFRQKHNFPGAFGKSDLYVICRLTPITFKIRPCPREVQECKWIDIEELSNRDDLTPLTAGVVKVALHGWKNGFKEIDIVTSLVKETDDLLYHRFVNNL